MLIHVTARVQRWSAEVMRKHPVELIFERRERLNCTFNTANFRVKSECKKYYLDFSDTLVSTVSSFRSSRHGLVAPGMPQPDRNTVGGESSQS